MRSVTMHELDVLRAEWAAIQKRVHACREQNGGVLVGCYACAEAAKEGAARAIQIEQKLQQWWAQGCKEVPAQMADAPKPLFVPTLGSEFQPRSEVLRADGLTCAFCGVRFTVTDTLHGAGDGSKSSSDEGARFMHSECFFRVEHARMKAKVMQLEAEEKARKNAKPDCACTIFDDGSAFYLSSFAGGGAPKGVYSYVTCIDQGPTGDVTHRHYDANGVKDADYWRDQYRVAASNEKAAVENTAKLRGALQRAHEDNAALRRQIGKLEAAAHAQPPARASKLVMPRGAREAADALAKQALSMVSMPAESEVPMAEWQKLRGAIETYQGVAENGHVPDIYDTVGRLDAAKIARLLVDVETGGALTMLIASVRDEVLTSLHRDHPGAVSVQEHLRSLGVVAP